MWNSLVPRVATLVVLLAFFTPDVAFGRVRWPERDGRAISLHPRRIVGTNPPQIAELSKACPSGIGTCAQLAGAFISTILAAAPECAQQDACDQIIDASKSFDSTTQANIISLAVQLRQVEKNTQPNFTTTPPTKRNSLYCQKCPRNPQLNGLFQAQDLANDPDVYADPLTGKNVLLGTQPDTEPFKGPCPKSGTTSTNNSATTNNTAATNKTATDNKAVTNKTDTNNDAATNKTDKTNSVCTPIKKSSGSPASSSSPPSSTLPNNGTSPGLLSSNASGANFGSCSTPQIKFGQGFDGRKETAFEPVDQNSYNHGSADNIGVITSFMCLALTNTCKANQAAKDLCAKAQNAASSATPLTGAQADAFNKVFGINTDFSAVTPIDNTGKPVGGASTPASTLPNNGTSLLSSNVSGANFGSCSPPEIKFAAGLDNRKETSFEPTDLTSYNHGSAQNINIITQFICDQLTNTCKANQQAKNLCQQAETAADATTPPKTGAQADVFNKFFGFTTDFKAVQPLDDHGQPVGGSGSTQPNNGSALTTATNSSASSPNFGSCSTPQIKFGQGFDGRKETAFEPVDQNSYNHGSADNIGVITSFICLALTNTCKANQAAKDLCANAQNAANSATPLTGAQADAFNKVFGINTDFTAVTPISNTGVPVNNTNTQ